MFDLVSNQQSLVTCFIKEFPLYFKYVSYFRGYYCLLYLLDKMSKAGIGGHEECRLVICAVCLSESGQKCTRTVSDSEVGLIKECYF